MKKECLCPKDQPANKMLMTVRMNCPIHRLSGPRKNWTMPEINWLKENYQKLGRPACARYLGRDAKSVGAKARELRVTVDTTKKYTPEEDAFIAENIHRGLAFCAKALGRSHNAMKQRCRLRGIRSPESTGPLGPRKKITPEDIEFIRLNIRKGVDFCAARLGVSAQRVNKICDSNGIARPLRGYKRLEVR